MENQILEINQSRVDSLFLKVNYNYLSLGEKISIIKIAQKSENGLIVSERELNFLKDMGARTRKPNFINYLIKAIN